MPLSKKEKSDLSSQHMTIEKVEEGKNQYILQMSLTEGAVMTLQSALKNYPTAISEDLQAFLNNAKHRAGIKFFGE